MAAGRNAPKQNRVRRGIPERGDWVTLEPLAGPVIPELDELDIPELCDGQWPPTSRLYWEAWRESPVTVKWELDDLALAVDTVTQHAICAAGGRGIAHSEMRLRMESLGLTAKGRIDRRFRLPDEVDDAEVTPILSIADSGRVIPEAI